MKLTLVQLTFAQHPRKNPRHKIRTESEVSWVVSGAGLPYDSRQRLSGRTTVGEHTSFEYWPTGQLRKATLPDASFLLYAYDGAQRLQRVEDSAGNSVTFDDSGVLALKHRWVFNSFSRLWKYLGAAETSAVTTTYAYDTNGNQTNVGAPLARTTSHQYDELNRLRQTTDAENGIAYFAYDALDQLTSITDPRGQQTQYLYNALRDLKQLTSPDTSVTTNSYDSAGNLATTTR